MKQQAKRERLKKIQEKNSNSQIFQQPGLPPIHTKTPASASSQPDQPANLTNSPPQSAQQAVQPSANIASCSQTLTPKDSTIGGQPTAPDLSAKPPPIPSLLDLDINIETPVPTSQPILHDSPLLVGSTLDFPKLPSSPHKDGNSLLKPKHPELTGSKFKHHKIQIVSLDSNEPLQKLDKFRISNILVHNQILEAESIISTVHDPLMDRVVLDISDQFCRSNSLLKEISTQKVVKKQLGSPNLTILIASATEVKQYICKGFPLNEVSIREIQQDLRNRNPTVSFLKVTRLGQSKAITFLTACPNIPSHLHTAIGRKSIQPFRKMVPLCTLCLGKNHATRYCTNKKRCGFCSSFQHSYTSCTARSPKCAWCRKNHVTSKCPLRMTPTNPNPPPTQTRKFHSNQVNKAPRTNYRGQNPKHP